MFEKKNMFLLCIFICKHFCVNWWKTAVYLGCIILSHPLLWIGTYGLMFFTMKNCSKVEKYVKKKTLLCRWTQKISMFLYHSRTGKVENSVSRNHGLQHKI